MFLGYIDDEMEDLLILASEKAVEKLSEEGSGKLLALSSTEVRQFNHTINNSQNKVEYCRI